MGGGAKVSGAGMKESKDVTSTGGFLALAKHINATFKLKDNSKWTGNIAKARFQNMMKSFRKAVKDIQLPKQEHYGNDKNAFASACEKCNEQRAEKCPAYTSLWPLLRDHPKYDTTGKTESALAYIDSDFESEEDEVRDHFNDENKGEESGDSNGNSDDQPDTPSHNKAKETCGEPSSSSESEEVAPRGRGSGASTPSKRSGSSPRQKKNPERRRKKFTLKKPSDHLSHADITRAYISSKDMQNAGFFALSILRERRATFFDCLKQGITSADEIKEVFSIIGLGEVPQHFFEYMASKRGQPDDDDEEEAA
jgi:hypothetical protein